MSKYQTNNHQQLELLEREVSIHAASEARQHRESSVLYKERQIKSLEDAYKLLKPFLVEADCEKFVVVCLDTKNQPVGSLNSSIVHPRVMIKAASASVIVDHNHPSGHCESSREDIEVTKRLVEAGRIVGIDVLGYLIVCPDGYCRLKKKDTYKNVNFAK